MGLPTRVELDLDFLGETSSECQSYTEYCPDHCSECAVPLLDPEMVLDRKDSPSSSKRAPKIKKDVAP